MNDGLQRAVLAKRSAGGFPRAVQSAQIQVSHGPMEIGVQMEGEETALRAAVDRIPVRARALLGDVTRFQPILRLQGRELWVKSRWPRVVQRMVRAVQLISGDLTPISAVAGAISDELLRGVRETIGDAISRILVNNGGDMALFSPHEPVRIGIRGEGGAPFREMVVQEMTFPLGVATSGWRGRSFSQGIADSVVVAASSGAVADAAATHIGNHVNVETRGKVTRRRAVELDPATDIPDLLVTVECGDLAVNEKEAALENGRKVARSLMAARTVWAAGIYLQGKAVELEGEFVNFQ